MKAEVDGKKVRVLTQAEVVALIRDALQTRVGLVVTEDLIKERANNLAQIFTFDGAVVTFGD